MDNKVGSEWAYGIQKRLCKIEKKLQALCSEIADINNEFSTFLLNTATSSINDTNDSSSEGSSKKKTKGRNKRSLDEDETDWNTVANKKVRSDFVTENGYVVVYTDGACENNGKVGAKAGIGVWFADAHPLNISRPVIGRATNNTAEIQACIAALQVLLNEGVSRVKIITDSQFTISCITKWIVKWKKNAWKVSSGGPVKNKEDLEVLDSLVSKFEDIQWQHVGGHIGVRGNEEADRLARQGALRYKP